MNRFGDMNEKKSIKRYHGLKNLDAAKLYLQKNEETYVVNHDDKEKENFDRVDDKYESDNKAKEMHILKLDYRRYMNPTENHSSCGYVFK